MNKRTVFLSCKKLSREQLTQSGPGIDGIIERAVFDRCIQGDVVVIQEVVNGLGAFMEYIRDCAVNVEKFSGFCLFFAAINEFGFQPETISILTQFSSSFSCSEHFLRFAIGYFDQVEQSAKEQANVNATMRRFKFSEFASKFGLEIVGNYLENQGETLSFEALIGYIRAQNALGFEIQYESLENALFDALFTNQLYSQSAELLIALTNLPTNAERIADTRRRHPVTGERCRIRLVQLQRLLFFDSPDYFPLPNDKDFELAMALIENLLSYQNQEDFSRFGILPALFSHLQLGRRLYTLILLSKFSEVCPFAFDEIMMNTILKQLQSTNDEVVKTVLLLLSNIFNENNYSFIGTEFVKSIFSDNYEDPNDEKLKNIIRVFKGIEKLIDQPYSVSAGVQILQFLCGYLDLVPFTSEDVFERVNHNIIEFPDSLNCWTNFVRSLD